jgi:hypothetical protein
MIALRCLHVFGVFAKEVWTKLVVLQGHCHALNHPYEHPQKTTLCIAPVAHDGHLDPAALDFIRAGGANAGVDARHGPPSSRSRGRAIC